MTGKCRNGCIGIRDLHRGFCGNCLKLKGVKQVLEHESQVWKRGALKAIRITASRFATFTADHVKDTADAMQLEEPHHPNCWGGVFHSALSKDYMHQTGKFIASTRAKHHKQRIAEYRSGSKPDALTGEEKWKARALQARVLYQEVLKENEQLRQELGE